MRIAAVSLHNFPHIPTHLLLHLRVALSERHAAGGTVLVLPLLETIRGSRSTE
jgi:hypothetical protein